MNDHEDTTEVWNGGIPWTLEGLLEAIDMAHRMHIEHGDGWEFGHMMWLQDHYGGMQGLAYNTRYREIMTFLREHHERLMDERLLKVPHDDITSLSHSVLSVLATVRFNRLIPDEDCLSGYRNHLDVDEVIRLAKERLPQA